MLWQTMDSAVVPIATNLRTSLQLAIVCFLSRSPYLDVADDTKVFDNAEGRGAMRNTRDILLSANSQRIEYSRRNGTPLNHVFRATQHSTVAANEIP